MKLSAQHGAPRTRSLRGAIGIATSGGYFRRGAEAEFPWDARSGAWYILLSETSRGVELRGFRSTVGDKVDLVHALRRRKYRRARLLGIWTGKWESHLFILNTRKAERRLSAICYC